MRTALAGIALASLIAGAVTSTAHAATHDNWSTFHHDVSHTGVSSDTTIGATHAPALAQQWSQLVGGGSQGKASVYASPVVAYNSTLAKNLVYDVSSEGTAHAFDAATGASIWTQDVAAAVVDSPALDGNTLYFGTGQGQLYALNATTGAVQCSYQLPIVSPETVPGSIQSSPVVGHVDATGPVVFFGDIGQTEKLNAGHEWAVNGVGNTNGDCTLKWSFNDWTNKGPHGTKTGSWSPPALGQDASGRWLLVFGSSNPDDSVYALNAATGAKVWRFQTVKTGGDQDVGAGPTISAPGVNGITDGAVYIDGKDKMEYGLDLLTGSQLWSFDMLADSGLKTNSVSCAALAGNLVVVAYSGYVYAFDAVSGAKVWRTSTAVGTILASVAVSGGSGDQLVLIGDLSGIEHGYRLSDGTALFQKSVGHKIHASTAVAAGMAYFASDGGYIYAFG